MTTLATLIERVRVAALGGHTPRINILSADIALGATSMRLDLGLDGIAAGSRLSIDRETFYVRGTDRNVSTVTVIPGMFGTTQAAHTAGALVEVNARWERPTIVDVLLEEINSWPPELGRIGAANLTYADGVRGYDLTALPVDVIDILGAFRAPDLIPGAVSNSSWPKVPVRFEREMDTTVFASGRALFVENPHYAGTKLRVVYSRPYDTTVFTDSTDLENTVGLTGAQLDVLKYGALWRLASTGETARTDPSANSDDRSDQAIPGMLNTNNARSLKQIRDQRISEEQARIMRKWHLAGW